MEVGPPRVRPALLLAQDVEDLDEDAGAEQKEPRTRHKAENGWAQ